jgi:AcrR family transcriptional regulator
VNTARRPAHTARVARKERRGRPTTPMLRERILTAAGELFADRDFEAVAIDDVAALAKVGKGSVYRQFESKEALYVSVVMEGLARLQATLRAELTRHSSFENRFSATVRLILVFFWPRRQFFFLLRDPKALPKRLAQQYLVQRGELARIVQRLMNSGIRSGAVRGDLDVRVAAETLLGMLRGINRYCRDYTTPEKAAQIVASIFLEGCSPRTTVLPDPAHQNRS